MAPSLVIVKICVMLMHQLAAPMGPTPEALLLEAIQELSRRLLTVEDERARVELRLTIGTLKEELLKLVTALPIPSESDIARLKTHMHSLHLGG